MKNGTCGLSNLLLVMCIKEDLEVLEYCGIFISNPEYRTPLRNNLLEQNELIAQRFITPISDRTTC